MTREQRLERTEKVEHMIVLPHACELDHRRHTFLGGRAQTCKTRRTIIGTFDWNENAGETSAVKSKVQPMKRGMRSLSISRLVSCLC